MGKKHHLESKNNEKRKARDAIIFFIFLFFVIVAVISVIKVSVTLNRGFIEIIDLSYWIAFGLVISFFPALKIFRNIKETKKMLSGVILIFFINICAISFWIFSPKYLLNYFDDGGFATKEEKNFYKQIREMNLDGKKSGDFRQLTNFEWDNFEVYTPYSPSEERSYINFYNKGKLVANINAYQGLFQRDISYNKSFLQFVKEQSSRCCSNFEIKSKNTTASNGFKTNITTIYIY